MAETDMKEDLVKIITAYLSNNGIDYKYDEALMRFEIEFCLDNEIVQNANCLVLVEDDGSGFCIIGDPHIKVKPATKKVLNALLRGINSIIWRGEWQMHDDEVRYVNRLSLDKDAVPTEEMLMVELSAPPFMIDEYADAIIAVIIGFSTAEHELKRLMSPLKRGMEWSRKKIRKDTMQSIQTKLRPALMCIFKKLI